MIIRQPAPDSPRGVLQVLQEQLVLDIGRHAEQVELRDDTETRWTTEGDILLIAVWRCARGEYERPVVLPSGDAAPARTLVEAYGLEPLVLRRLRACWN